MERRRKQALPGARFRPAKEILHYDILHAMHRRGFLDRLVFHGGTALRLCHWGVRLSEALDFCAGPGLSDAQAAEPGPVLQQYLEDRYGFEAMVSQPRDKGRFAVYIRRWRVRMAPDTGGFGGSSWFRIKLEIADVQSGISFEAAWAAITASFQPAMQECSSVSPPWPAFLPTSRRHFRQGCRSMCAGATSGTCNGC